jgi:hypothetical protein
MRCDTFGFNPSISDTIVELYWSVAHVDSMTASISLPKSLTISTQGSQATSKIGLSDALANLEVAAEAIATLRNLKG